MAVAPAVAEAGVAFRVEGTDVVVEFARRGGHIGVDKGNPIGLLMQQAVVRIEFEVAAEPADFGDELNGEALERANEQSNGANRTAQYAIVQLRQWARTLHPWLAHPFGLPAQAAAAVVEVVDTGRVLPLAPFVREHQGFSVIGVEPISAAQMAAIGEHVSAGDRPDPARQLLADARYLAHWAPSKDPPRSVLVAAIACEVRVKGMLRERAKPPADVVLDVLLDNPRAFPHSAIELFDKVSLAVDGRSLRLQDKELYKRLGAVFEIRNKIAHHGYEPTLDEARQVVGAAMEVFEWLDASA